MTACRGPRASSREQVLLLVTPCARPAGLPQGLPWATARGLCGEQRAASAHPALLSARLGCGASPGLEPALSQALPPARTSPSVVCSSALSDLRPVALGCLQFLGPRIPPGGLSSSCHQLSPAPQEPSSGRTPPRAVPGSVQVKSFKQPAAACQRCLSVTQGPARCLSWCPGTSGPGRRTAAATFLHLPVAGGRASLRGRWVCALRWGTLVMGTGYLGVAASSVQEVNKARKEPLATSTATTREPRPGSLTQPHSVSLWHSYWTMGGH